MILLKQNDVYSLCPITTIDYVVLNLHLTYIFILFALQEVEIITCPLGANYDRSEVVDYSEPVFSSKYGIIYPRPIFTTSITGLILPFSLLVRCFIILFTE